jgi:hypothetical protein
MEDNKIICPKCGTEINVSEILYKQVEQQMQARFEKDSAERDAVMNSILDKFKKEKAAFEAEKQQQEDLVRKQVAEATSKEKERLARQLREQIETEKSDELKLLKQQLSEQTDKVKELNRTKADIERLKREKDALAETISLEKEKELNTKLKEERTKIAENNKKLLEAEREKLKEDLEQSSVLKIRELEKKLQDQTNLVDEMKRKAEQGSMQLQGEVQELAIEEILRNTFIYDTISEVPKGIRGADVVQTVKNRFGNAVGTILFESKRTKSFGNDWVSKLKSDAVFVKADICVLVSEALPENIERIGQIDGVWVCSFNEFKGLVMVLRETLIKLSEMQISQTNKGDKMQMLYDYLTSNEFLLQVCAIVEGFSELQRGYIQERNNMEKLWKQREKQLEKVLLNTNHFIGSIQGIAGSSIALPEQLDIPKALTI